MPKKNIYTVFILMMIMLLAACGDDETEKSGESGQVDSRIDDICGIHANMDKETERCSSTDHNDETFALDHSERKWWVADLVFTNCTTVCLPMTTNLSS